MKNYPWWPVLLIIPVFGWLLAAAMIVHDAMQTLPYRLQHSEWKIPVEG